MKLTVVVGGQYGSEGKGNVAGELHRKRHYDWGVRVGGPNAGHTVYDRSGNKFALRQVPVAAAVDNGTELYIGPGSEVDVAVLDEECGALERAGHAVRSRLHIHPEATVITEGDYLAEQGVSFGEHGSTRKGIGAARAHRAMRTAKLAKMESALARYSIASLDLQGVANPTYSALVEGTQGYALGSHAGNYPHCTSGDCCAIDFMAQAGVGPFQDDLEVWVVLRTFPIRIAGESGPLKNETTWEIIGVEPEFTTVTKKVRRVGGWDARLAQDSIAANGGEKVKVALTFADYWWPELKGLHHENWQSFANEFGALYGGVELEEMENALYQLQGELGAPIEMVGTGPSTFIHTSKEN